jgi:hypothetical protein
LSHAIYENYEAVDQSKIEHHLKGCEFCKKMIDDSRATNPIYLAWKANVPNNLSEEEFWDEMSRIRKEAESGPLDEQLANNPVYKFYREQYETLQLFKKAIGEKEDDS